MSATDSQSMVATVFCIYAGCLDGRSLKHLTNLQTSRNPLFIVHIKCQSILSFCERRRASGTLPLHHHEGGKHDPVSVGAADLARVWMSAPEWQSLPGSNAAGDALKLATTEARAVAMMLRSREAAAVTRAAPLVALEAKGLRARDWLSAARQEQDAPVLLLES